MWTSSQARQAGERPEGQAQVGVVTVSGRETGVYLNGERRWLPVFVPGGYRWRPGVGESVLVLKTGQDGEQPCVLGRELDSAAQLEPGEAELYAPGCSVRLNRQGGIELTGKVTVNGVELSELIRSIAVSSVLPGLMGE